VPLKSWQNASSRIRKWYVCLFRLPSFTHAYHLSQTVLWNTVATECQGDGDLLNNLRIKNVQTGEERDLPVNGLFYAIGHEPATKLVQGQVQTDEDGYIVTVPGTTQTSVKGVFAAGDVQDKRYRQAITSAGSGCMAALEAERLLAEEEDFDVEDRTAMDVERIRHEARHNPELQHVETKA
jgi:pyruvate/2-oxoglutarate dehydrogenase complex dihydrolipoamide dehydrogenase (E3) component